MACNIILTSPGFLFFQNLAKRQRPTIEPPTDSTPIIKASSISSEPQIQNYTTAASELINIVSLESEVNTNGFNLSITKLDVKIRDPLIPKEVIKPDINV